jgi:hypothetical protein
MGAAFGADLVCYFEHPNVWTFEFWRISIVRLRCREGS